MGGKSANKAVYFDKLKTLLEEYKSIFIVSVDNVSSQQMHEIRHSLRGEGVVLMGKNTMVSGSAWGKTGIEQLLNPNSSRCVVLSRALSVTSPNMSVFYLMSKVLLPFFSGSHHGFSQAAGNVGFIFTNSDLKQIREKILSNKVAAPARAGAVAPADVSCLHIYSRSYYSHLTASIVRS